MTKRVSKLFIILLGFLLLASNAFGLTVTAVQSGSDGVTDWVVPGYSFPVGPVAEGRIGDSQGGNRQQHEMGVGYNTSAGTFSGADYDWVNGMMTHFVFDFDGSTAPSAWARVRSTGAIGRIPSWVHPAFRWTP